MTSDDRSREYSDKPEREETETPGGIDQEPVERRPNVGTTTPEQYPQDDRAKG